MAIRDFFPHSPAPYAADPKDSGKSKVIASAKSKSARTMSIASASLAKAVHKTKELAKRPKSASDWYESEDRNLPSVSSF